MTTASPRWRAALAALVLAGAGTAALANDAPPRMPTRDVVIESVLKLSDPLGLRPAQNLRISFSAAAHRARIESTGDSAYIILDPDRQHTLLVDPVGRAYAELPFNSMTHFMFILSDRFVFKPAARGSAAGIGCDVWDMWSATVHGTLCVSDDGVVLRMDAFDLDGDGDDFQLKLIARKVSFQSRPARDFAPPAGFEKVGPPR